MVGQERHDLPADLQVRDIPIEVEAVHALQVQPDLPAEQVGNRRDPAGPHRR